MLLPLLTAALLDTGATRPDTIPTPVPSSQLGAPVAPPSAVVRLATDDELGDLGVFTALGAELRLEAAGPTRAGRGPAGPPAPGAAAELRVSKRPDALTSLLAARLASGRRLAAVTVELPGASDTLRVRLVGVAVVAARLVFPAPQPDLEGQRLAQEVVVSQAGAERAEAARQLAEAEALAAVEARDARKLVPANALARARDQVRLLDLRLAAATRQRALLEERAAREAAPTEEVTLRADRAEILGGGAR